METLISIGEAAEGVVTGRLGENALYMGGEHGGRGALMVHGVPNVRGATPLGDTGLYVGGIADAMQRVDAGKCDPDEFKFFFNMAKFAGGELQQAVVDGRWSAYEGIPRAVILRQDPGADRDTCLLYTSPSPRDATLSRMPSSA